MIIVSIADTNQGLRESLEAIFAPYGGVQAVIPQNGGTIYIKPNGVHFSAHSYTDPAVLEALLAYLRDHGYRRLAVMESATGGNFTRLVFRVIGYTELCKRYGAEVVYLDEGPVANVPLRDGTHTQISRRLYEQVVRRKEAPKPNFYLSLPKLKTHSMGGVTLGVKNQQAFPVDADRMERHTHDTLHLRLAALYDMVQPDFCIIEGLYATAHGHIPAEALLDECLVPMNVLVGGRDTLAVDAVGARILGYAVEEIEHLRICAEWGLGQSDLAQIEVRGLPLSQFTRRLPNTPLNRVHPQVRWVVGREKACIEGCYGNSLAIQELLYNDYHGKGGWTLVCGRSFEDADLEGLPGDILVVGKCTLGELGNRLHQRYPDRRIYEIPENNDLMANTRYQARLMGITPLQLSPLNPLESAWLLLVAKLNGLKARVPPIFG